MQCKLSAKGLAVIFALFLAFPGIAASAQLKTFTVTSGPLGGDFYSLGGVVAETAKGLLPGTTVTVNTGGAIENILKIEMGKADLGTSMVKLYLESLKAEESYAGRKPVKNVKVMMYVSPMPMSFFLVKADSTYTSIEDLVKNKRKIRILTSKKGSSPAAATENVLKAYGASFDDIRSWGGTVSFVSYAEASSLIQDGHADAYVGPVVSSINELITSVNMKMLPIKPEVLAQLKAQGYSTYMLAKDRYYFVPESIPHLAESVILPVRADLPDDFVYNLAKALCEKPSIIRNVHPTYQPFDPAKSADNIGHEHLHPGAAKYYKEQGWID